MIESERKTHTSAESYPYPKLGSYFRLEGGTLLQLPMLVDGGRRSEEEIAEVESGRLENADREQLSEIERELMSKE